MSAPEQQTIAFRTPEPRPAVWATTTDWPIRLRLGRPEVHAAANLLLSNGRRWPWMACGQPAGDYQTPMPAGWQVTCRGCRQALAAQTTEAGR